jgi:hypothetical protein
MSAKPLHIFSDKADFLAWIDTQPFTAFPMLGLSDRPGFIPWAIEGLTGTSRKKGRYNHAFVLKSGRVIAEQLWRFQETPLTDYLDSGKYRIKIWFRKDANGNPCWQPEGARAAMEDEVNLLLTAKGKYDWLGVWNQGWAKLLHFSGLKHWGISKRNYCSEASRAVFRLSDPQLFADEHPSPSDIDRLLEGSPDWASVVLLSKGEV